MRRLHVQIHERDRWRDAFSIRIEEPHRGHRGGTVSEYETSYPFDVDATFDGSVVDQRAVSVDFPINLGLMRRSTWPPFLLDMMPQGEARAGVVQRLGLPSGGDEADLPILIRTGGQPIGNLRIREAVEQEGWFAHPSMPIDPSLTLEQIEDHSTDFAEVLTSYAAAAAGSSGVQGVWPKLMLTLSSEDGAYWPDSILPDRHAARHFIVKTSASGASERQKLILRSEPGYLEVARACGLRCGEPLRWLNGTLLIPRFDRAVIRGKVQRHGQESLVSALGVGAFGHMEAHETYLGLLKRVCTDPAAEVIEYVRRDLLAVAMGDTDNHGRNTALQKRDGWVCLTPVFDFAPMRLDEAMIIPSTRWRFGSMPHQPAHLQHVCEQAAEGTALRPGDVLRAMQAMLPALRTLPALARQHCIPEEVIAYAIVVTKLADLIEVTQCPD